MQCGRSDRYRENIYRCRSLLSVLCRDLRHSRKQMAIFAGFFAETFAQIRGENRGKSGKIEKMSKIRGKIKPESTVNMEYS